MNTFLTSYRSTCISLTQYSQGSQFDYDDMRSIYVLCILDAHCFVFFITQNYYTTKLVFLFFFFFQDCLSSNLWLSKASISYDFLPWSSRIHYFENNKQNLSIHVELVILEIVNFCLLFVKIMREQNLLFSEITSSSWQEENNRLIFHNRA